MFNPPEKKKFESVKLSKEIYKGNAKLITWSGHSTFLYQNLNVNVLTDPHFTNRASPLSFLGPKRYMPSVFNQKNIPRIDIVVISHNHYDHLDIKTVKIIFKENPEVTFLVPLGLKYWFNKNGFKNVIEFDWWESFEFNETKFVFVPVQHWSKRTFFDRNKSLWGGWWIENKENTFLHLGDTGYSKDFIDIKNRLGSPDIAAIPIGAYAPRDIMKRSHLNPEEAVQCLIDLDAGLGLAMHWGTFILTHEPVDEPVKKLYEKLKEYGIKQNRFKVLKHGESVGLY